MKSVAELAIVALIGTVTIMAGIIIPPAVIKTTVGKEILLAYKFENAQHGLLSLLSSTQDGKQVYELIGMKIILGDSIDMTKVTSAFDKTINSNYCILVDPKSAGVQKDALTSSVCQADAIFNTVIAMPYNKDSLVKVVGIGVK